MKNVLIISNRVLSETDNNGKTLLNLIRKIPSKMVSQLYFYGSLPEVEGYNYFQISNKDIISGKINHKLRGRQVFPIKGEIEDNNRTLTEKYSIKRTAFKLLVRDLLWKNSWISEQLISWLDNIKPEYIFFMAGDAVYAYEICLWIKEKYQCKLFSYVTDDYILKRSQESFWEKKHRLMVLRALKECANSSAVFFTICERMRKEYKRVLGVDSEILFNRCSSLYDKKLSLCSDENDKIIFLYAGSLYYGREKALIELAKALKKINIENGEKGKEAVLHIYLNALPSDSFLHEIQELGTAKYLGKLDFKELKIKLNECNYPVFVESFEEKQMEKVQLSFSTKIPEYLSLEKTILAIGPDNIGSMDCLRNVAVCINSIEEIYAKVEHLLHYPEEFSNLGLKARQEYEKIMEIPGLEEYIVCE